MTNISSIEFEREDKSVCVVHLSEEQFISIYLSALKLGLFKAEARHLYARAG